MKHNKSKSWLLHRLVSTQSLLSGHMSAQYVLCGHIYIYIYFFLLRKITSGSPLVFCYVCTEWTVLLVPLILLVIVNVLVDTSAQIKVTKGPERGQITLSKLLSQYLCCSNNCMSMDGQDVTIRAASMGAALKKVVKHPWIYVVIERYR